MRGLGELGCEEELEDVGVKVHKEKPMGREAVMERGNLRKEQK